MDEGMPETFEQLDAFLAARGAGTRGPEQGGRRAADAGVAVSRRLGDRARSGR
jgi:hypothetical protein